MNQCTCVSTFASSTSPCTVQSLQKSFHLSHADKIELKKISSPSENKKYATAQTKKTQTMAVELNNDNGLQTQWTRTPAGNMGLASCGVKCLNSSSVFQINFCAGLTVLCPVIPHERQAQNRCKQPLPTFFKICFGNLNIPILFCLCFVAAHTAAAQSQTQNKASVRAATPTHNRSHILLSAVVQNMNERTF